MPADPRPNALEAAQEHLMQWFRPEEDRCGEQIDTLADLITRREREAVAEATPEIERRAKVGALENLRKVIAAGAARSYADATLITLAWVDKRIEDAIKAGGGSDAGR
jgi:hypothetical protein